MPAAGIVPSFDELEASYARLGLGAELAPIEQRAFERGEEALAHGIVVGVADLSHRGSDIRFFAAQPERHGRVLG